MVADESEADDTNSLENTGTNDGKLFTGVTFEFGGYVGAFNENGCYDDEHSYER